MVLRRLTVLLLIAHIYLTCGNKIRIEITHWNDVSGQIESFLPSSDGTYSSSAPKDCPPGKDAQCVGGVVNLVNRIFPNVTDDPTAKQIRLSTGNLIGGESGWISAWAAGSGASNNGWELYGKFVAKHLKPDIVAIGMKEFGAGVPRTVDFIKALGENNSVLANTCSTGQEQEFCKLIKKVIRLPGELETIGVIGFVTPSVEQLSLPGNLKFDDVILALQQVVADSQNSDIKTFIAIGDGNLQMARDIIDKVRNVKIVIYGAGFSNTNIGAKYPFEYNNGLIATAGRYGSSIGKLVVDWESTSGEISLDTSRSKLISTNTAQLSKAAIDANSEYSSEIRTSVEKENKTIGQSRVTLQGGSECWRKECNLGNLVADAMVHCALSTAKQRLDFPVHSIWHGGALFEDKVAAGAQISKLDVHKWLPYHNRAHLVKINGTSLLEVFRKSATGLNPEKAGEKDWRQFLQVSNGIQVYYSNKSETPELTKVRMTHDDDGIPRMNTLQENKDYYLVIPTYLFEGRGVYGFAKGIWTPEGNPSNFAYDDNCVENYIQALGQVSIGFEERIWIDDTSGGGGDDDHDHDCPGRKTALTVFLTILFFSIFVVVIFVGYKFVLPRLLRPRVEYPPNQL